MKVIICERHRGVSLSHSKRILITVKVKIIWNDGTNGLQKPFRHGCLCGRWLHLPLFMLPNYINISTCVACAFDLTSFLFSLAFYMQFSLAFYLQFCTLYRPKSFGMASALYFKYTGSGCVRLGNRKHMLWLLLRLVLCTAALLVSVASIIAELLYPTGHHQYSLQYHRVDRLLLGLDVTLVLLQSISICLQVQYWVLCCYAWRWHCDA